MLSVNELSIKTLHSIIKDLQENNIQLKKENRLLENKLEQMKKEKYTQDESNIMDKWLEQSCDPADNILAEDGKTLIAPTPLRALYDNFAEWCSEVSDLQINQIPDMMLFKKYLKKWQEKSKYGLHYGKRKNQAGCNGYEANMLFNLKL